MSQFINRGLRASIGAGELYQKPKLLPVSGPQPYEDEEEMVRDMADPRYHTDEKFRHEVEARIGAAYRQQEEANRRAAEGVRADAAKVTPFASGEELASAFNDPRYQWDPDYQRHVQARMVAAEVAREQGAQQSEAVSAPEQATGPKPFRSGHERAKAYADARYATDPDYREEVAQREAATQE